MKNTNQTPEHTFWLSDFGEMYLERNYTYDDLNDTYKSLTGINIDKPYHDFFLDLSKEMTILELGCNVGLKLEILKKMGFKNLTGIDLNSKALKEAKRRNPEINFINSTIEDLDVESKKYDLVFTSVVLIHQNPKSVDTIIKKIIELSKKYIFGYEYYSEKLTEIDYRGHKGVMWKQDFPSLFKKIEPQLKLVKQKKYRYLKNGLEDIGYLFQK